MQTRYIPLEPPNKIEAPTRDENDSNVNIQMGIVSRHLES